MCSCPLIGTAEIDTSQMDTQPGPVLGQSDDASLEKLLAENGQMILLVKPQFEAGREKVGKNGVVRDPELHKQILEELQGFFQTLGLAVRGVCASPLLGPAGNREFFIYAAKQP